MKRLTSVLIACFLAMLALCFPCGAAFGTDELAGALPEDAREILTEHGVTPSGGAEKVSPSDILGEIAEALKQSSVKPMKMFGVLLAVTLLSAVLTNFCEKTGGPYSLVTAAAAAMTVSGYLGGVIDVARSAFRGAADFMLSYIPVAAGVTAAGGHTASAAVYSSVTVGAIQMLAWLISSAVIPLTSCILGISAASAVGGTGDLDKLGEGIKKAVTWGLGLIMTLFLGILSVQTVITSSADNAAMKTLKFTVSNAVPIVGGAVSDALATVKGSIAVLKSGVGGFGIAAGACVLVPPVLTTLCYRFFLFAAGIVSDLFGCPETGRMIKSGSAVMTIINAALCCFLLFIVVSSAILMMFCRT